jgi:hypothetical protein
MRKECVVWPSNIFGPCCALTAARELMANAAKTKAQNDVTKRAPIMARHYFAMQTFFGSVKNRNASSPPSRPTPLAFMPPNGTRRSRTSQQFTQTVPV